MVSAAHDSSLPCPETLEKLHIAFDMLVRFPKVEGVNSVLRPQGIGESTQYGLAHANSLRNIVHSEVM